MIATIEWSAEKILASLPRDPGELMAYKFPEELQQRVTELIDLSKSNRLDDDTREEIERYMKLESDVLALKVKAFDAMNNDKKGKK